jgi:hypothetical protein
LALCCSTRRTRSSAATKGPWPSSPPTKHCTAQAQVVFAVGWRPAISMNGKSSVHLRVGKRDARCSTSGCQPYVTQVAGSLPSGPRWPVLQTWLCCEVQCMHDACAPDALSNHARCAHSLMPWSSRRHLKDTLTALFPGHQHMAWMACRAFRAHQGSCDPRR